MEVYDTEPVYALTSNPGPYSLQVYEHTDLNFGVYGFKESVRGYPRGVLQSYIWATKKEIFKLEANDRSLRIHDAAYTYNIPRSSAFPGVTNPEAATKLFRDSALLRYLGYQYEEGVVGNELYTTVKVPRSTPLNQGLDIISPDEGFRFVDSPGLQEPILLGANWAKQLYQIAEDGSLLLHDSIIHAPGVSAFSTGTYNRQPNIFMKSTANLGYAVAIQSLSAGLVRPYLAIEFNDNPLAPYEKYIFNNMVGIDYLSYHFTDLLYDFLSRLPSDLRRSIRLESSLVQGYDQAVSEIYETVVKANSMDNGGVFELILGDGLEASRIKRVQVAAFARLCAQRTKKLENAARAILAAA